MRTIKPNSRHFTCMATFSHRIAAACDDGTVGVYDSVTGALRLSLSPGGSVRAVRGSPDGSMLFCAHQGPSVTVWDIQTGGLIRTYALESQVECIAICSKGRYFACGLSDCSVKIWELENQREFIAFKSGSHITHLCWLEPGEQLVVARGASVQLLDVVSRAVLRSFGMQGPVCGVAYAQKLNRFAVAATSETESVFKVVDLRTGASFTDKTSQRISCLTFSPITKEFVCGMKTPGLKLFSVLEQNWRQFGHSDTIMSVSTLSSGTVVANVAGSGIQLLSLDEGHAPPQQQTVSIPNVHAFDEDNVTAILPASRAQSASLETTTTPPLPTIPVRTYEVRADRPPGRPIICASLKHRMVVCCFDDGCKSRLELWKFGSKAPEWTRGAPRLQLVGGISPGGSWLVVIEDDGPFTIVRLCRTEDGTCIADLLVGRSWPGYPLEVKFESEDKFYSHHGDCCVPFIISPPGSSTYGYSIICHERIPSKAERVRRYYDVDDAHEWVIGSSKRIHWIPPGYIGSYNRGHWWDGDTLTMLGQDEMLRKLTFRKPLV